MGWPSCVQANATVDAANDADVLLNVSYDVYLKPQQVLLRMHVIRHRSSLRSGSNQDLPRLGEFLSRLDEVTGA